MKILFVTIPFREYITEISEAISKELSASIDVVYCDVQLPFLLKGIDVLQHGRFKLKYNKEKQLNDFMKCEKNSYDYIFVLVGRNVEVESLNRICKKQKNAKKILYLWDDIARINTFEQIKFLFDDIISFDTNDCKQYGFKWVPLFYCDKYRYTGEEKDIVFSCIAGLHSRRENYISRLENFCDIYNFTNYFHLQASRFPFLKELISGGRHSVPKFIKFNELSMEESSHILKRSVCVVDMPHPTQTGLTIRTIEALASQTKLITTNKAVKEYDFYNENNILVTDSDCSNLTEEFVRKPYVKINDCIIEKYSLNSWVRTIFRGA